MKTTVELSDELFRRVKAEAALRGRKLKDLVEEGLRLVLESPHHERGTARPTLHDLMQDSSGIIEFRRARSRLQPEAPEGLRPCRAPPSLIPAPWLLFWTGANATTPGPWNRCAPSMRRF